MENDSDNAFENAAVLYHLQTTEKMNVNTLLHPSIHGSVTQIHTTEIIMIIPVPVSIT